MISRSLEFSLFQTQSRLSLLLWHYKTASSELKGPPYNTPWAGSDLTFSCQLCIASGLFFQSTFWRLWCLNCDGYARNPVYQSESFFYFWSNDQRTELSFAWSYQRSLEVYHTAPCLWYVGSIVHSKNSSKHLRNCRGNW